jgi:hypothetical protein
VVHGELEGIRSGAVYPVVYENSQGWRNEPTSIAIRVRA